MKYLTRDEQRLRHNQRMMAAVGLECHLHNLIREIKGGRSEKLIEFQQFVQYAPSEMRARIRDYTGST